MMKRFLGSSLFPGRLNFSLKVRWRALVLLQFVLTAPTLAVPATWKAGIAKQNITPENGLWLAGYATRDKPADGKVMELWVKALALEDAGSNRAVIVTSDTLGIPQNIYLHTLGELKSKCGLNPQQIILSASHTHCGPALRNSLYDAYPLTDEQRGLIEKYPRSNLKPSWCRWCQML